MFEVPIAIKGCVDVWGLGCTRWKVILLLGSCQSECPVLLAEAMVASTQRFCCSFIFLFWGYTFNFFCGRSQSKGQRRADRQMSGIKTHYVKATKNQ